MLISGFKIHNANFEGILIVNASHVTITVNHVVDNNKALDIAGGTCPGMPAFETNEGDDCGEGIHLMAADHSSVVRNEVDDNSGGILITDETGTNHNNLISGNSVHDNPFDCFRRYFAANCVEETKLFTCTNSGRVDCTPLSVDLSSAA